ncbi:MAG: DUF6528 family protein [Catalinimonas sp.]
MRPISSILILLFLGLLSSQCKAQETIYNSDQKPLYFLGSDQSDGGIKIFSDTVNALRELTNRSIWKFLLKDNQIPTDAKRVDKGEEISVIVAAHGSIYQVPMNYNDKYVYAKTYISCHSVEILPDGNMISANSNQDNDNTLTLHFNKKEEHDRYKFEDSFDVDFHDAHGVVYDKQRELIWALGTEIGKFKYICCPNPKLVLLDSYPLPPSHTGGHDLFPDEHGNLLVTSQQGVLRFEIDSSENLIFSELIYSSNGVKSVVSNIQNGDIYITSPEDISGYKPWQTDKIINLNKSKNYVRPNARFYKVRLWQKNNFSYN